MGHQGKGDDSPGNGRSSISFAMSRRYHLNVESAVPR